MEFDTEDLQGLTLTKCEVMFSRIGVQLEVPKIQTFSGKNEITEKMFDGVHCRQCNGTGFIKRSGYKESCPMCGGSGNLIARITVEWIPDNKIEK